MTGTGSGIGRATAKRLADTIPYLASEEAPVVTGHALVVDGGYPSY